MRCGNTSNLSKHLAKSSLPHETSLRSMVSYIASMTSGVPEGVDRSRCEQQDVYIRGVTEGVIIRFLIN